MLESVAPDEASVVLRNRSDRRAGIKALAEANLSPSGDLVEAAARLFQAMRTLDSSGAKTIQVQDIPNTGLGEAINDRLRRAAAPRS